MRLSGNTIFLFMVLCLSFSKANAQLTVQTFANNCRAQLGLETNIPGFNCEHALPLQSDLFGVDTSCAMLSDPGCRAGQRLGRLEFSPGDSDVAGIFICRKYANHALTAEQYSDIALILHNKTTGKTCFFQSHLGGAVHDHEVPSPHANNASNVWRQQAPDNCVSCHNNDPYIVSPHVVQAFNKFNLVAFNPKGATYQVLSHTANALININNRVEGCAGACHYKTNFENGVGAWMPSGANIGGFWHKSASIKHTKADFDVFRPAAGKWFHLDQKTWTWSESPWGISGDKAMSADFDGDGDTDTSIWRSSTKQFWVNFSSTGSTWNTTFGNSTDIPVPADYDFDGRDDIALYRPSTGEWFLVDWRSWTFTTKNVGQSGGVPAPADFDGDRKADPAIWIPSTGNWHVLRSSGGPVVVTQWGLQGDIPAPADFTGDGIADRVVFRPSDGKWYIFRSDGGGSFWIGWGQNGDIPVPADFDADGKVDPAVFRSSNGTWYYAISSTNYGGWFKQFGQNGDQPVITYRNP
ncbi:MAG: VCBS repeat-containing protein [Cellvibrionaceae bacterium]|nr:VCBS repeat-containing protein [Cellvibrionaceae bacterium]